MKTHKSRTNWLVDLALFAGFLAAFWLDLTGLPLHQMLGMLVGAIAGYHLLAHWTWVKSVTAGWRKGTANQQCRTLYALDAAVMLGLFLTVLNGLVISTWLALPLNDYFAWRAFHVGVSVTTLLLVVLKLALHWRWIVTVAKRHIFPAAPRVQPQSLQPAAVPVIVKVDRREFLKLMGVVGVTATLALGSALNDTFAALTSAATLGEDSPAVNADAAAHPVSPEVIQTWVTPTVTATATTAETTSQAASTACVVRCSKGCYYPGSCKRYTDANKNGRCDLGECL